MGKEIKYLDVKDEVARAIAEGKPVVALESTIISHGMPYPQAHLIFPLFTEFDSRIVRIRRRQIPLRRSPVHRRPAARP